MQQSIPRLRPCYVAWSHSNTPLVTRSPSARPDRQVVLLPWPLPVATLVVMSSHLVRVRNPRETPASQRARG